MSRAISDFSAMLSDAVGNRDTSVSIPVKDGLVIEKALNKTPRLFIYVSGGLIQNIVADQKIEVMVLDADVDGMEGGKTFTDSINGSKFEAREAWDHTAVEVSKKIVDHYFRQRS